MLSPTIESFLVYDSTWCLNFLRSSLPCAYAPLTSRGVCTSTSDGLQMRFVWFSSYLAYLDVLFKYSLCSIRRRSAILHSFQFFFIPIIQTKEELLAHRRTFINAIFTTIALQVCFGFLALRGHGPKNKYLTLVCRAQIYKDDITSVVWGNRRLASSSNCLSEEIL